MVKLTTKYLIRILSSKNQIQQRKKNETNLEYLNRLTHLYLQSQFIDKIAQISECQSVTVIYLQNNLLQSIHNMNSFPKLTHLYLQHNYISKLENLKDLKCLKKLHLGWNEISVVEGLEGLNNLTELYLENQRLPPGETLYFDPLTVLRLSKSLKILNVSNNNLSSVSCLEGFTSLSKLFIERNRIGNAKDLVETLTRLPFLEELNAEGNPVTCDRKYFDAVVFAAKSLKLLDGKVIRDQTRTFIINMVENREIREKFSELSTKAANSEENFFYDQNNTKHIKHESSNSRIGSKLFPVLKKLAEDNRTIVNFNSKKSFYSFTEFS